MMMDNNNRQVIVDRIKKLLGLAADNAAHDGEIENAMEAANRLIRDYQVEQTELDAASPERDETYGKVFAPFTTVNSTPWMGQLAQAVAMSVGSVQCYRCSGSVTSGTFGRPEVRAGVQFYGPEADVMLAKAIFDEWLQTIATIAYGRYGGIARGDGRNYCLGFASALMQIARTLYRPSPELGTAIVPVAQALEVKRAKGSEWLRSTGVRLRTGGTYTGVTNHNAFAAGRSDGANSGFGRAHRTRALGA